MRRGVIYICIVVFVFACLYFFLHNKQLNMVPVTQQTTAIDTDIGRPRVPREVPVGLKEYQTSRFHFSILYPEDLTVTENISTAGSLTVVFENTDADNPKGFQIFVTPYTKPQITPERFKNDLPSGVRKDEEMISIAGVQAVAFHSVDENLGETREVWFIEKGLLYEVTTPRLLEGSLSDILTTWEFI